MGAAAACDPCSVTGCNGISFLASTTPKPKDVPVQASGGTYYFQLCADTDACGPDYTDGQVCLYTSGTYVSLGRHAGAQWSQPSGSELVVLVTGGDDYLAQCYSASANITVRCDSGSDTLSLLAAGRSGQCTWQLSFDSKALCAQVGSSSGKAG